MAINLLSTNVGVFPTTGRPQKDPLGRLTTEYNLTSLINTLLDVDGFVITNNIDGFTSDSKVEFQFNIKGYIFTIHDLSELLNNKDISNFTNLYASININKTIASTINKNLNNMQSIDKGDNNGHYEGLNFTDNTDNITTYLHILEKLNDGKWYIPEESKIKLRTGGNNRSISIDDGELN